MSGQVVESRKPYTQAHLCVWAAQPTEEDNIKVFWKHQVTTAPGEGTRVGSQRAQPEVAKSEPHFPTAEIAAWDAMRLMPKAKLHGVV